MLSTGEGLRVIMLHLFLHKEPCVGLEGYDDGVYVWDVEESHEKYASACKGFEKD